MQQPNTQARQSPPAATSPVPASVIYDRRKSSAAINSGAAAAASSAAAGSGAALPIAVPHPPHHMLLIRPQTLGIIDDTPLHGGDHSSSLPHQSTTSSSFGATNPTPPSLPRPIDLWEAHKRKGSLAGTAATGTPSSPTGTADTEQMETGSTGGFPSLGRYLMQDPMDYGMAPSKSSMILAKMVMGGSGPRNSSSISQVSLGRTKGEESVVRKSPEHTEPGVESAGVDEQNEEDEDEEEDLDESPSISYKVGLHLQPVFTEPLRTNSMPRPQMNQNLVQTPPHEDEEATQTQPQPPQSSTSTHSTPTISSDVPSSAQASPRLEQTPPAQNLSQTQQQQQPKRRLYKHQVWMHDPRDFSNDFYPGNLPTHLDYLHPPTPSLYSTVSTTSEHRPSRSHQQDHKHHHNHHQHQGGFTTSQPNSQSPHSGHTRSRSKSKLRPGSILFPSLDAESLKLEQQAAHVLDLDLQENVSVQQMLAEEGISAWAAIRAVGGVGGGSGVGGMGGGGSPSVKDAFVARGLGLQEEEVVAAEEGDENGGERGRSVQQKKQSGDAVNKEIRDDVLDALSTAKQVSGDSYYTTIDKTDSVRSRLPQRSETIPDAGNELVLQTQKPRKKGRRSTRQSKPSMDKIGSETTIAMDDDLSMKRDFLIKLAKSFAMYGAPTHRLEYHIAQVSQVLEVDSEFIVFPGIIMASFGGANTHIFKTPQGFHMAKLAQVNALCLVLTRNLISVEDAIGMLDGVKSDKDYSPSIILATFPVTSFSLCVLGFGGGWVESLLASVLGLIVGLLMFASEKVPTFTYLFEFVASLACAFISRSLQNVFAAHNMCFNYVTVSLSAIAILLPGLSLTIAIIELSTRNLVSGTTRLFGALFTALLLGFGMTIGGALVFWPLHPTESCQPLSPYWGFLFFWPMSMAVNLFFQAHRKQMLVMTMTAAVGWVVSILLSFVPQFKANSSASTAIASLAIGLCGNVYARITHDVVIAPIMAGILLQVPGSLGVRSSLGIFAASGTDQTKVVDGIQFTFNMLAIGMSLAIGLFLATWIVWPIRGPKFKYLTI